MPVQLHMHCYGSLFTVIALQEKLGVRDAINLARVEDNVQLEHWGYVEGGHDIDEADSKIRVLASSVFLRLLKLRSLGIPK